MKFKNSLISGVYSMGANRPLTKWEINQKKLSKKARRKNKLGRRNKPKELSQKAKYALYLESPAWQVKRLEMFALRGRKCEKCGLTQTLQVHHLNYKRVGQELPTDLQILCRACHKKAHRIK